MTKTTIRGAAAVLALAAIAACGGSAYLAQSLDCVDKAKSRAEADACRAKVDQAWGVTDAGVDQ